MGDPTALLMAIKQPWNFFIYFFFQIHFFLQPTMWSTWTKKKGWFRKSWTKYLLWDFFFRGQSRWARDALTTALWSDHDCVVSSLRFTRQVRSFFMTCLDSSYQIGNCSLKSHVNRDRLATFRDTLTINSPWPHIASWDCHKSSQRAFLW